MLMLSASAVPAVLAVLALSAVQEPPRKPSPEAPAAASAAQSPDDARTVMKRAVDFLLKDQRPDGSWCSNAHETLSEAQYDFSLETWYCFKMGANGLAVQ